MGMAEQTNEMTRRVDADSTGPAVNHIRPVSSAPARGGDAGDASATSAARCAVPRLRGPRRWDSGPHRLRSGHWVWVRPLHTDDGPALAAAVERLSVRSRYRRFHTARPRLTQQTITYLTDIDHHHHEALVALAPAPSKVIVGVARFVRDPAQPDTAEVAVVVADSWQRRGLATLLLHRLARRAREERIVSVTGYILSENYPTLSLLTRLGPRHLDYEGTTVTARMDLAVGAVDDPDRVSYRLERAAVEVALVPLANLVSRVVHGIWDAFVEVITMFRALARFLNRVFRRLLAGRFASTTHFVRGATPRVMAQTEVDGTGRTEPIVLHGSLVLLDQVSRSAAYRGIDHLPAAIRVGDRRTCTTTGPELPVLRKEKP